MQKQPFDRAVTVRERGPTGPIPPDASRLQGVASNDHGRDGTSFFLEWGQYFLGALLT